VNDNAEAMPWADASFDAVSSVFLFHELPPMPAAASSARRGACSSRRPLRGVRLGAARRQCEIEPVLYAFRPPTTSLLQGYLRDDLAALLTEAGFAVESGEPHLYRRWWWPAVRRARRGGPGRS